MSASTPSIVRTTTLELNHAPAVLTSLTTSSSLAVMQVPKIPVQFYRYLYANIGAHHYWLARNNLSDSDLEKILHAPGVEVRVMYVDGAPAGFAEIESGRVAGETELSYFGLLNDFHGRGLGKWFLGQILTTIWTNGTKKIVVSTDSLDHPAALTLYQKFGFSPVSFAEETMENWLQDHHGHIHKTGKF